MTADQFNLALFNEKEGVTGPVVYLLKSGSKGITPANVATEVMVGKIGSLLPSITSMIKHVLMPALKAQEQWGVLPANDASISGFLSNLDNFVGDIDSAMVNLDQTMKLQSVGVDLAGYKSHADYAAISHRPDDVVSLEGTVGEWCKQVEKVLAESEQVSNTF